MKRKDSQIVGLFTLIQRVLSPLEKGEKEEKFFPPLETSQKLLRTRSLRPTVQLKCFVKGALFLKKKNPNPFN